MDTTMLVLRVLHIGSGVFWGGAVTFVAYLLLPAVRAVGPSGGQVMRHLAGVQKFPVVVATAGALTILSGAGMYWHNMSLSGGTWTSSRPAMAYGVGALFALITFITGVTRVAPTAKKIVQLGGAIEASGTPATPEQASALGALQATMWSATRMAAANVAIATIIMAIARYL